MATACTQQMASELPPNGAINSIFSTTSAQDGIVDPEQGAAIRRQVEFYFSDENLPGDLHLLQCCSGRQNEPVSINRISGFKKMRIYPKRAVAQALRHSAFLDVSEDGRRVKRKVPLQGLCALDEKFYDEDDIVHDPRSCEANFKACKSKKPVKPAEFPVLLLHKTKAAFSKGTSKNMMKPTGFEQTYIEPPMTPQEAAEGQAMFGMDNPLDERIKLAIQIFKEKRRMHEMYAHVFNKLMRFGGVESTPRVGQGVAIQELAGKGKQEKAELLATHSVPEDYDDEDKWVVDFASLAKAFLSWYPAHYGYAPNAIKNACQVPRSFYNFLRYHNVCPEYNEQLMEALKICDIAEQELPKVYAAGLALPGDFNKSASALFDGAHAGLYAGDKSWAEDMKKEGIEIVQIGIREEEARIKFGTGIATMSSDDQGAWLDSQHLETLEIISTGLEIIDIELPSKDIKTLYREQSKISEHKAGGQLEALGRLTCKTWHADDCDEWDLPRGKYPDGKPQMATVGRTYEFWVEESILKECFVGLKIDGRVLTLEGGITILDEVRETMCSFFTWLPNELWMDRKPKQVTWLSKGMAEDIADVVLGEAHGVGQRDGFEDGKEVGQGAADTHAQDENYGENRGKNRDEGGDGLFDDE